MVSDGRTCIGGGLGAPRIEKTASFRQSLSGALLPLWKHCRLVAEFVREIIG